MKKSTLLTVGLASIFVISGTCVFAKAQDGPQKGPKGHKPPSAEMKAKMLEKFDANNDGELCAEERKAMHKAWQAKKGPKTETPKTDTPKVKKDEKVTKAPEGNKPPNKKRRAQMLEKYDTDKDGKLSDAERKAMRADMPKRGQRGQGLRGNREEFMKKYDTDKDGKISLEERKAAADASRANRGPARKVESEDPKIVEEQVAAPSTKPNKK